MTLMNEQEVIAIAHRSATSVFFMSVILMVSISMSVQIYELVKS